MACEIIAPIGSRFGRLVVISIAEDVPKHAGSVYMEPTVLCRCDCGNEKRVRSHSLLRKIGTKSCGCLHRETIRITSRHHGEKVGGKESPEYQTWMNIRRRCEDSSNKSFERYGGRGIRVCKRWHAFENFLADMGRRPTSDHSIDRHPDNSGHYQPGNCRWATRVEQGQNKRNNVLLTFDGETLTVAAWARKTGIDHSVIRARIKYGWSAERILTESIHTDCRSRRLINE
jgi:hypothetical protein